MMTNQHLITPPPELLQQWVTEYWGNPGESIDCGKKYIATQAARWGAEQQLKVDAEEIDQAYTAGADSELEACCDEVHTRHGQNSADWLLSKRRPKPPSLKEQALRDLDALVKDLERNGMGFGTAMIRRALEALPND